MYSKLAPSFLPATCVLEMTYKCNHKCIFCSCPWEADNNYKKRKELSLQEWKDCIKLLTENGVCSLAFTGGEAILNKDLKKIIEFAGSCISEYIETKGDSLVSEKKPPSLYLISNGTLLNDKMLSFCKTNNVHLSMSLPGLSTYKFHTQTGNYQTILKNFKKAKELGIKTTVNITVTKKNLFELYETISAALLAGADTLLLNRFLPGGRGLKHTEFLLSKEEITEMLDTAEEVLKTANRSGSVGTELPKCIVDTSKYSNLKVSTKCSAAINFFVISPSGYIRTCNHSPVELCHFSEYESLKSNEYWKRFTQKDYIPTSCNDCTMLCECDCGCREAAHVFLGNLDSQDPVFI
ncbi:MAG: radical SAM protein [Candidatus Gastranaerophilales bacterium]|nr:radical SAM protein [Candidatus Gastranaerophilales bacterium]